VVLEDVAAGAGLLVEGAPVLDPDRFGDGDLDVVDVAAVPDRLEDSVGEAEDQQVPDGLLAEVVIDPVDLRLPEDLADLAVQADRRVEVVAERLLDDDPAPAALVPLVIQADPAELGDDLGELRRLRREVVEVVARRALLAVDRLEGRDQLVEARRVGEVAALVADPRREESPGRLVEREDPRELLERLSVLGPKGVIVVVPSADRQDDELVGQEIRPPELVEGRDHLAMSEVAGRPEQDQGAGVGHALEAEPPAKRVVVLFGRRLLLALSGKAHILHRPRRVLRPRRGMRLLVGRGLGRHGGRVRLGRRLAPLGDRRLRHCRVTRSLPHDHLGPMASRSSASGLGERVTTQRSWCLDHSVLTA
jgi:hypothetical protein